MLCICSQHPGSAFYVTFEQCVETLRIIKKGDTVTKAELFFHMADRNNNG